jgi:hypothetical protein
MAEDIQYNIQYNVHIYAFIFLDNKGSANPKGTLVNTSVLVGWFGWSLSLPFSQEATFPFLLTSPSPPLSLLCRALTDWPKIKAGYRWDWTVYCDWLVAVQSGDG